MKTSVNKIGEIINLSQELNSLLWDNLNKNNNYDYSIIYSDICKLAVMSCMEIDKAKKEFSVNILKELNYLRTKYTQYIKHKGVDVRKKPAFFKNITINNGYSVNKNICYKNYRTTMDYLQSNLNSLCYKFYIRDKDKSFIKLSDIISNDKNNCRNINYKQINIIIRETTDLQHFIIDVWKDKSINKYDKRSIIEEHKNSSVKRINKFKINNNTAIYLLSCLDNKKYSSIKNILFEILFNSNDFINVFKEPNINNLPNFNKEIILNEIGVAWRTTA